jgi:spermidine/putrescine transport system ATP-binding protein
VRLGDFALRALNGETGTRGETRVVIRPERVRVEPYESTGDNRVPGMIERVVYLGSSEQLVIRLATGDVVQALVVNDGSPRELAQGTAVQVHLPAEALRVLSGSPAPAPSPSEPEALAPAADAAVDALGAG